MALLTDHLMCFYIDLVIGQCMSVTDSFCRSELGDSVHCLELRGVSTMRGKFVLAPNGDQLVPSCLWSFFRGVKL